MEVRVLNNLNCKICLMPYDEEDFSPRIMPCGHSICKSCFIKILSVNKFKCPYCNKQFNHTTELPVNFEILSMVLLKSKENFCSVHPNELLNFYCKDDKQLICQLCLLNFHISHNFIRPEDSEIAKSIKFLNEYKEFKKEFSHFIYKASAKFKEQPTRIDDKFNEISESVREIPLIYKYSKTLILNKIKRIETDLDTLNSKILSDKDKLQSGSIQKFDANFLTSLENIKVEIEALRTKNLVENIEKDELFNRIKILLTSFRQEEPTHEKNISELFQPEFKDIANVIEFLMERNPFVIRYILSEVSKKHEHLILNIIHKTECNIEFVINIMNSIDRICFVPDKPHQLSCAYTDSPLIIGWNTTISAPYMHMITLSYIYKHFESIGAKKNHMKGIDIGCGSGYMTLCISKLLGPFSVTYGIDHIDEIVSFAKSNISKHHKEYISKGRIRILMGDGREDKNYGGPFNVIHVGAAVEEIPNFLYQQLDYGGIMWIPVGPKNNFKKIFTVIKDEKGVITKNELMTVSYAEMVSSEEQLREDINEDEYDDHEANLV